MNVKINGFDIDISNMGKKITHKTVDKEIIVTYQLNFPPHTASKIFKDNKEAMEYIDKIKTDDDKVTFI